MENLCGLFFDVVGVALFGFIVTGAVVYPPPVRDGSRSRRRVLRMMPEGSKARAMVPLERAAMTSPACGAWAREEDQLREVAQRLPSRCTRGTALTLENKRFWSDVYIALLSQTLCLGG